MQGGAGSTAVGKPVEEIVIRPPGAFVGVDFRELWQYRGILWRKVQQRVRIKYDDLWLGLFWGIARPLFLVAVFWGLRDLSQAKVGVSIAYPLYVYSGLVFWLFFTEAVTAVASSLQRDAGVIQRVYFPRLISPLSHLLAEAQTLLLSAVPLALLSLVFRTPPDWKIVLLPAVVGQIMLLAFGVGLIFAAFTLLYGRDWERVLKFMLSAGLWVAPVLYSVDMIPGRLAVIYMLNPVSGGLVAVRAALFHGIGFPWAFWAYAAAASLVACLVGVVLFQHAQAHAADRL